MREQPPQQAPPVQRVRLRYAKRGRLRFTSHRDFSRAFERAVSRSGIPVAFSSGFNPHPRISYAGASPTGAASEAEYLEIGLAQEIPAEEVRRILDEALPAGLDVVAAHTSTGGALADTLQASRWLVELLVPRVPAGSDAAKPAGGADGAVAAFLSQTEVLVSRMTKRGMREFDTRAAVTSLVVADGARGADLDLVLQHGTPAVRPDDVVSALVRVGGLTLGDAPLMTRVEQGLWDAEAQQILDPFAAS